MGSGCPDLLIGFGGNNYLVEIKNMDGRGMRFTPAEREFMDAWKGKIYMVTNIPQALELLDSTDD